MSRKCDCLNDCGDDPALQLGKAEYCDRAKKQIADVKSAKEKQLRDVMKLADEYAQACAEPNSYTPDLSRRRARKALKDKIKELIDAKA